MNEREAITATALLLLIVLFVVGMAIIPIETVVVTLGIFLWIVFYRWPGPL